MTALHKPLPTRGPVRLLRVAVLGGSSLALAAAAHLAGGGMLPSNGVLVVVALLLGLSAVTLTARRCRFGLLVAVLAVQQVLLHWVFGAAAGAADGCAAVLSALQHHAGMIGGHCSAMAGGMSGGLPMPGWGMWLAHGVAVIGTAWLLTRGEAWLWRTADFVADAIVGAASAEPAGWPSAARPEPTWPLVRVDLHSSPLLLAAPRGPPHSSR